MSISTYQAVVLIWGKKGWPKQDVFNGIHNPGKGHISTPPGISGPTIIPSHFCSVSGSQKTGQKFGQLFMGPREKRNKSLVDAWTS